MKREPNIWKERLLLLFLLLLLVILLLLWDVFGVDSFKRSIRDDLRCLRMEKSAGTFWISRRQRWIPWQLKKITQINKICYYKIWNDVVLENKIHRTVSHDIGSRKIIKVIKIFILCIQHKLSMHEIINLTKGGRRSNIPANHQQLNAVEQTMKTLSTEPASAEGSWPPPQNCFWSDRWHHQDPPDTQFHE